MYPEHITAPPEEYTKNCKIVRIEYFRFNSELTDKVMPGHGTDYHYGILAISTSDAVHGIGKFIMPSCAVKGDLVQWVSVFQRIKGLTFEDGLHYIQRNKEQWGFARTQLIESAFNDLDEKLRCSSAGGNESGFIGDRAYLFDRSEAYISF